MENLPNNSRHECCDTVTGVIDGLVSVQKGLETWTSRFDAIQKGSASLSVQQRALLFDQMEHWTSALNESVAKLGSCPQPDKANMSHADEEHVMYVIIIVTMHIFCCEKLFLHCAFSVQNPDSCSAPLILLFDLRFAAASLSQFE